MVDAVRRTGLQARPTQVIMVLQRYYLICKVLHLSEYALTNSSATFLVPIGTTAPCRRREPPVLEGASAGGE